jgi:hypothetical protein
LDFETREEADAFADSLIRTPPTVSLDEVERVLEEIEDHQTSAACMTATEATERTLSEVQAMARALLTRLKERHAPSQS